MLASRALALAKSYTRQADEAAYAARCPPGERVPPSLQNISKELATDVAGFRKPGHGDLEKWAAQGVLLLNATLTVRKKQAGSHQKKGWEVFTDAAVRHLSQHRSGLVFLLWGKFAQDRARVVDTGKHHILKSVHPSGLCLLYTSPSPRD